MHEVLRSHKQIPTQKFHQNFINFEKSQNFQNPQNLGLNAWNAWRMREKEHIPSDLKQGKAKNHMGWRFRGRRKCLGGE